MGRYNLRAVVALCLGAFSSPAHAVDCNSPFALRWIASLPSGVNQFVLKISSSAPPSEFGILTVEKFEAMLNVLDITYVGVPGSPGFRKEPLSDLLVGIGSGSNIVFNRAGGFVGDISARGCIVMFPMR